MSVKLIQNDQSEWEVNSGRGRELYRRHCRGGGDVWTSGYMAPGEPEPRNIHGKKTKVRNSMHIAN